MSNEGKRHMHANCYLAIAIAYTIAVVAYAILAFTAYSEEQHERPAAQAEAAVTAQSDPG